MIPRVVALKVLDDLDERNPLAIPIQHRSTCSNWVRATAV